MRSNSTKTTTANDIGITIIGKDVFVKVSKKFSDYDKGFILNKIINAFMTCGLYNTIAVCEVEDEEKNRSDDVIVVITKPISLSEIVN